MMRRPAISFGCFMEHMDDEMLPLNLKTEDKKMDDPEVAHFFNRLFFRFVK